MSDSRLMVSDLQKQTIPELSIEDTANLPYCIRAEESEGAELLGCEEEIDALSVENFVRYCCARAGRDRGTGTGFRSGWCGFARGWRRRISITFPAGRSAALAVRFDFVTLDAADPR